jgi:putative ABC transport system permease protein
MSLTFRLARRNLLQDKLRFIATIIGIVFSIILVNIQLGLFLSFERMVTTMIEHAPADLWVVPFGTKCFEDASLLNVRVQAQVLSVPGVTSSIPVLIGFTEWTVPSGGSTPVFVIGSSIKSAGLHPWGLVAGNLDALSQIDAVAVDRTYSARLGVARVGDSTDIRDNKATVMAITNGIRSFTTTPYVFTSLERAQTYTGTPADKVSYFLLHVAPGADISRVRKEILTALPKVEVLTPAEFLSRSRSFWLFGTGAGAALFAGALLGAVVGTVIVAQTLYSSTKDHLNEFATLRAIGSSSLYIHKVIVWQAMLSAVIGFAIAAGVGLMIVRMTAETALPIIMTLDLTAGLFVVTVLMCVVSAIVAIVQVMRIDPVRVFTQ